MSEIKLKHVCGFFYRILYQNIKTLILFISGVTFFYLLISGFTSDAFLRSADNNKNNLNNKKQLILNTNYHVDLLNTIGANNGFNNIPWDNTIIQLYLKQLDIEYYAQPDGNNHNQQQQQQQQQQQDDTNNNYKCLYDNVLTVLSHKYQNNDENIDNLWEYLSLLALCESHLPDNGVQIYLTKYLANFIEKYFEDIIIPIIPEKVTEKCFNLQYAQIIGDTTYIPVINDNGNGNTNTIHNKTLIKYSPILLERGVKRYQEILLYIDQIRTKLDFKQNLIEDVNNLLVQTKILLGINQVNVTYISIYIAEDDNLPIEYYKRAMDLHRKFHENIIFIISCDKKKKFYYHYSLLDINEYSSEDTVIYEHNEIKSHFVFISLLNHTIVSNNLGAIGALMNGGDTIVYQYKKNTNEHYLPSLISEEISNWYSIR